MRDDSGRRLFGSLHALSPLPYATVPYATVLLATVLLAAGACSVNPVTGRREIVLMSESQEIALGQQNYLAQQQMEGGPYQVDPVLTRYVSAVGHSIAAVSDRPDLPWEFVVLNSSVPNAWALPGGKIGMNRGLLTALETEAELAAVLAHEVVHAAARHTAQQQTRGMAAQVGLAALSIGLQGEKYGELLTGAAGLGSTVGLLKYGRSAELESDLYGMRYMARAGYDPYGAVRVQEQLLALSQQDRPPQGWLAGLFSTHPPSQERVDANRATLREIPPGDYRVGRDLFAQKMAELRRAAPAYEAYDEGLAELAKGNVGHAARLAKRAISIEPREAAFHSLRAKTRLAREDLRGAVADFDRAIERNPDVFETYVGRGMALAKLGEGARSQRDLRKSLELLPTPEAHYMLGELALTQGNRGEAVNHFAVAASSQSRAGELALGQLVRLELPRQPEKFLRVGGGRGRRGNLRVTVENPTPIDVRDVIIQATVVDGDGHVLAVDRVRVRRVPAGQKAGVGTRIELPTDVEYRVGFEIRAADVDE